MTNYKENLGKTPPDGMSLIEQYNYCYISYEQYMKMWRKAAMLKNRKARELLKKYEINI